MVTFARSLSHHYTRFFPMKPLFTNTKSNKKRKAKERKPRPFMLAVMLTGILAFEAEPNFMNNAIADAEVINLPMPAVLSGKPAAKKFSLLRFPETENNELKISANTAYIEEEEPQDNMLLISQNWLEEELFNLEKLNANSPKPNSGSLAQNTNELSQLPAEIAHALREDLQRKIGIPPTQVKVTEAERQTWPNSCLGLAKSDELCAQMLVEGWRVVLSDDSESWVYRTDDRGRQLRMEPQAQEASFLPTMPEVFVTNTL